MLGNGYLYFSGQDLVSAIPTFPDIRNSFTYEFWVKPAEEIRLCEESITGTSGTWGQRYAVAATHAQALSDAGAGVSVGTNGIAIFEHSANYFPTTLVFPIAIRDWTHVAVVYWNKTPLLYVNGEPIKFGLTSPMENVLASGIFGGVEPYGYFVGGMDDVRVWSYPRSREEIQACMNIELNGNEPGLAGNWTFNNRHPFLALDSAKDARHGAIQGAQWQVYLPNSDFRWENKYPSFLTDHLEYLKYILIQEEARGMLPDIVRNTRYNGYLCDVLMMFTVYRDDMRLFFYPVAEELGRQGRSVSILLPKEEVPNIRPLPNVKWIVIEEIAAALSISAIAGHYFDFHLKPWLERWFHAEKIEPSTQGYLLEFYRRYAEEHVLGWAILQQVRPRCVYGLHYILNPGYLDAIKTVSRQNKIWNILMQHGFLTDEDSDWHDFRGADAVILWGTFHKELLERKPDLKASIVIGNPKLEALKRDLNGWPDPFTNPGTIRIVYFSSGSPKMRSSSKEILDLFIEGTKNINNLQIVYKPHPATETPADYSDYVANGSIRPEQIMEQNAYELIMNAHLVVGDRSTVVFEAAALGRPVLQIGLPHHDPTYYLFDRVSSAAELREKMTTYASNPKLLKKSLLSQDEWVPALFGDTNEATRLVADFIVKTITL